MRLLSLFSGIGAFEKALDNTGIKTEIVNYCEIDKHASIAYSQIHDISEEKNLNDIRFVKAENISHDVDLVTYGFPCQDISIAGKQQGFLDTEGNKTRSGLFFEAMRIIRELKPKVAIAENVKALVSKKFTEEFETIRKELDEAGYNNYYEILNAKDFGIPQNRERVFIVSIRKDFDRGGYKFPEKIPLKLRLKDLLEKEVDEKFYLKGERVDNLINELMNRQEMTSTEYPKLEIAGQLGVGGERGRVFNINGISSCLSATDYKDPVKILEPVIVRSVGRNPDNPGNRTPGIQTEQRLEINCQGISNTLTTVQKDNYVLEPKIKRLGNLYSKNAGGSWGGNVYDTNFLSPVIQTSQGGNRMPLILEKDSVAMITSGVLTGTIITPEYRIRKLTPKECWRLMGFTDSDFDKVQNSGISNTQLYKMAGNSICVPVLEAIFRNLFQYICKAV